MKNKTPKKMLAFVGVAIGVLLLSGCGNSNSGDKNTPENSKAVPENKVAEQITQKSDEEQIKDMVKNYYSLLGDKKFGDAYKDVADASGASNKEFVDAMSKKGDFVTGFKDINYNYVDIKDDNADISVTINWNVMQNPIVSGDTYSQSVTIQAVKENSEWKIKWEKPTSENN